jgi:hypothetical protein
MQCCTAVCWLNNAIALKPTAEWLWAFCFVTRYHDQEQKGPHVVGSPQINKLFRWVVLNEGSGLKLEPDRSPVVVGKPGVGGVAPLGEDAIEMLAFPIMDAETRHEFEHCGAAEFTHLVPENGALFRVDVQRRQGRLIMQAMLLGAV